MTPMRSFRRLVPAAALAIVALLLAVACTKDDATSPKRYPLTVNFTNMNPHVGQDLFLRIVHDESGVEVGFAEVEPITTPDFSVTIPDVLVAGESYHVDWYADLNGNYTYDAPPVDHAWRRQTGPASAGPYVINFTHDTNWTDIQFPDHG